MTALNISIIIPAYNEERRLGDTLQRILSYMGKKGHDYEIIVIDDGSRDGTIAVAERFQQYWVRTIRIDRNRGKGYAVRQGMLEAKKSLVLFSDADLSTPIEELEYLAGPILAGEVQVAIGSRAVTGARIEVSQPAYRVTMGKLFNIFVRMIAIGEFHDTQCGFKLFTRNAAQEIFRRQRLFGYGFDVEILTIARRLGFQVTEVPVRWTNSAETKVDLLRDSTEMFFDLFKIRLNDFLGRYN